MYKVKGLPHMLIGMRRKIPGGGARNVPLFRFDADGFYYTEDEKVIARLRARGYVCEAVDGAEITGKDTVERSEDTEVEAVTAVTEDEPETDAPSLLPPMVANTVRANATRKTPPRKPAGKT